MVQKWVHHIPSPVVHNSDLHYHRCCSGYLQDVDLVVPQHIALDPSNAEKYELYKIKQRLKFRRNYLKTFIILI